MCRYFKWIFYYNSTQNKKTEELISDLLNVNFSNGKAKANQFLTRKEIVKIVREKYGK